ncbi:MAG: NAD(P)-dependent glycerol-3-phosphate dehydrogenase [Deltaproteobacteria bacterium]|nr:NAD(P)-dependent glycerol-3-phosphate dehydrogenase [Deltaproteobacteria bacterium]
MNAEKLDVGVVGAGAWGTALADQLARLGHDVQLWCYEPEVAVEMRETGVNRTYLPGHSVHRSIDTTTDLQRCVKGKSMVVVAVPSHHVRRLATDFRSDLSRGTLLVSASKGIENETLMTMSEIYSEVLESNFHKHFAVLSGPSFAIEVARGEPTALTIASWDHRTAARVQRAVSSTFFRGYTTTDVVGVEIGGALKNVVAIAVGAMDGMGFGHNTRAGLMTRGLSEMARIAVRKGANPLTISGLSGLGDLILTCTGELSRNRTFGVRIGKGEKVQEILSSQKQVVEGYLTARSAHHLARQLGVEAAIIESIYEYLHENEAGRPMSEFVHAVMSRDLKPEFALL